MARIPDTKNILLRRHASSFAPDRRPTGAVIGPGLREEVKRCGESIFSGARQDLASVPVSSIPEEFRKLSRFLPVIVLIPKYAVHDKTTREKAGPNKSVTRVTDAGDVPSPLDAAKAWFKNPSGADTFEFGGITVCFSTMEIHRHGQPITLTCKEFKTLEYFIRNPRRVISRDELLNEVWGYENYPCTRTVDNHILRLRHKLETESAHPKHFYTVRSAGYKFLP